MMGGTMMRTMISALVVALSVTALLVNGAFANTDDDAMTLANFAYAEFALAIETVRKHTAQVDACLAEMDRFEAGEVFSQPIECPKLDGWRAEAAVVHGRVRPVVEALMRRAERAMTTGESLEEFDRVFAAQAELGESLEVFMIKLKQAHAQTERVRAREQEIMDELKKLFPSTAD
jgi:hypothetical protein